MFYRKIGAAGKRNGLGFRAAPSICGCDHGQVPHLSCLGLSVPVSKMRT